MKYISLLFLFFIMGSNAFISAYTFTIRNDTGSEAVFNVCTTPGINSCQDKRLKAGETQEFKSPWYNAGLCLHQIQVDGKDVDTWYKEEQYTKDQLQALGTTQPIDYCFNSFWTIQRLLGDRTMAIKMKEF